jgi:hypothetical protein
VIEKIIAGGIADTIRAEVWMYLFGFYSFISTPRYASNPNLLVY